MNAPAAPLPPERSGPKAEGCLTPRSWQLEDGPAGAAALPVEATRGEPPLLWLIDRRRPLAAELRRQLADSLSPEERQRHGTYRLDADRERFLLGRGGMRRLLGAWLGQAPQEVRIETGPQGKPHCRGGPRFNLSHSGDLILLALHPSRAVGVDVERLRPELDWQRLAQRLLSPTERDALETAPLCERAEAFLAAWCRLEARLKARGLGLAGLEALRREEEAALSHPGQRREHLEQRHRGSDEGAAEGTAQEQRDHDQDNSGPAWNDETARSPGVVNGQALGESERIWEVAVPAGYRAAAALAPDPPGDPARSRARTTPARTTEARTAEH